MAEAFIYGGSAPTLSTTGIPYFLDPNVAPMELGVIDFFNPQTLTIPTPLNVGGDTNAGVWDTIKSSVSGATSTVYDSVSGTWKSVTDLGSSALEGIENKLNDTVWGIVKIGGLIFIGLLVVVWVLGKSGIIGQAAPVVGAIYGRG